MTRTRWMAALAVLAVLGLGPLPVAAESVEDELGEMQQRLEQLEASLEAASQALEASDELAQEQQALIEQSGIAGAGASSGLATFLGSLEVGGWVNGSYWYNFNKVDNDNLSANLPGVNQGAFGTHNFYNPDSNTFSLDQLWFELRRPVDESQRAGFGADVVMGKLAELSELSFAGSHNGVSLDEEDFYVHQAYAEYLADFGNGVSIKAGKFATLIGYEVIQAPYNDQISRGIVWQNLQPVDHVGVLLSTQRRGWEAAVGYVNGFSPLDRDNNDGKSVLARVGYSAEDWSIMLNGIWGPDVPGTEFDKLTVGDLIVTWQPNEDLSLWANGDFLWADPQPCSEPLATSGCLGITSPRSKSRDAYAWGAAVGGRLALTERTGVSVRGEYLADDGAIITRQFRSDSAGEAQDVTFWSVTGTVDHKLTDQLMVRAEVRWDTGRLERDSTPPGLPGANDQLFAGSRDSSSFFTEDDQILVGVDITYLFN